MSSAEPKQYRFAFIGLGCANSLVVLELHSRGLLSKSKIVVIEPSQKIENDRTFCFWMSPNDHSQSTIHKLTSHNWKQVQINNERPEEMEGLHYYHIRGIDLYDYTRAILEQYETDYIPQYFSNLPSQNSNYCSIELSNDEKIHADWVFDSRPTNYVTKSKNTTTISQSFIGWEIETEESGFNPEVFVMMDFSIQQSGSTQFIYVLPFSPTRALVEITRFGNEPIPHDLATKLLNDYLERNDTTYEIKSTEAGKIIMSSGSIELPESPERWINTGIRGGKLKPSTGYSFSRNLDFATQISEAIEQEDPSIISVNASKRFAYYDRLLLKILSEKPQFGAKIFSQLFQRNKATRILSFLDEKTSFIQDIKLLTSLPIIPFLGQAIKDLYYNIASKIKRIHISLFISLLLVALQSIGLLYISAPLLILFLFLLGIPHGALDHLTVKPSLNRKSLLIFILTYLFLGSLVLALFYINPTIGLIFFLAYSSVHFGQTDLNHWGISSAIIDFIWGAYVLLSILITHSIEVSAVLSDMGIPFNINFPESFLPQLIVLIFGIVWIVIYRMTEMLQTILLLVLLAQLPLIYAFGTYFVFHHSMHGWLQLKSKLKKSSVQLWKSALPFTLGSLLLFTGLSFFKHEINWGDVFIFLAVISFPHVYFSFRFLFAR